MSQQSVIDIADDVDSALNLHELIETTIKGKVEVMTELNQIGDIDIEDKFYMKAKSKLNKLKKEERIVLIIARRQVEESTSSSSLERLQLTSSSSTRS